MLMLQVLVKYVSNILYWCVASCIVISDVELSSEIIDRREFSQYMFLKFKIDDKTDRT